MQRQQIAYEIVKFPWRFSRSFFTTKSWETSVFCDRVVIFDTNEITIFFLRMEWFFVGKKKIKSPLLKDNLGKGWLKFIIWF